MKLLKYSLGLILFSVLGLALTGSFKIINAYAQSDWTEPVNLSLSGSTINPVIVVDTSGITYVIWEDTVAGSVYTKKEGDQWSAPTISDFPFESDTPSGGSTPGDAGAAGTIPGGPIPKLVADPAGFIHAFWIDEDGILLSSRVASDGFGEGTSWSTAQSVAESAVNFDVTVDNQGNLNLAYVRPLESEDFPAGVYYRKSVDNGASYSEANLLYKSRYVRSLDDSTSSIHIDTNPDGDNQEVYVSWDNRPIKRVYFARSQDGGTSWTEPVEVDGPIPTAVNTSPFNIIVRPNGNHILLVWQAGLQSGFDCTQYYQYSQDKGITWSERQVMLEDLVGCPQDNQFFRTTDGLDLLSTTIQDQVYLLAWDGSKWSTPQPQAELYSFNDPDTYEAVNFRCRKMIMSGSDQIKAVGCNPVGNADVWFTSRSIGSISDWFPPASEWTKPVVITSLSGEISSPTILTDSQERLHVFWIQPDETDATNPHREIFYTRKEGDTWAQPAAVLKSPDGDPVHLHAVINQTGRLLVAWNDNKSGEIYFSWVDSALASSENEWNKPIAVPSPAGFKTSPEMLVDQQGIVYIAYTIPLNETRGVYIVKSSDQGITWSDPTMIFDAAAAGWDMVDMPVMTMTENNNLHVIWHRFPFPGLNDPVTLYYSRSNDGGATWSEPVLVTENSVKWSTIVGSGTDLVHRIWESEDNEQSSMLHDYSQDTGASWNPAQNISKFGEIPGPAVGILDSTGMLHLVDVSELSSGSQMLDHSIWNSGAWSDEEGLLLDKVADNKVNDVTAAISPDGRLSVVYSGSLNPESGEEELNHLYYTNILLSAPQDATTPGATESLPEQRGTTEPVESTPIDATPTPQLNTPTPTIDASGLSQPGDQDGTGIFEDPMAGILLGSGLSVVIVGIIFFLGVRFVRGRGK